MAALTCDICGGQLSMDPSGEFAVCESCGMKHSKDRVKAKVQEITGVVKIDDTEAVKEQLANWKKMADSAYDNKNFSEAYTYYCKILEKDVNNWRATFRKGLSLGWQANLRNMHANEVVGGTTDAIKLLYLDRTLSDNRKANEILRVTEELESWIKALYSLSTDHLYEYGKTLVSVVQDFYKEMRLISSVYIFTIGLITEYVYDNSEKKHYIGTFATMLGFTGNHIRISLESKHTVKTGTKWNSAINMQQPVFETVIPDDETIAARKNLQFKIDELSNNIKKWTECYEAEMRDQYWLEHSEEKKYHETRLTEIDAELSSLTKTKESYDAQISEEKGKLSQIVYDENQIEIIRKQKNDLIFQRSKLGFFSSKQKKQIQSQIDELELQIKEQEKTVSTKKEQTEKEVDANIKQIEAKKKPVLDRIVVLESEKEQINEELTKSRVC
ncbi:MAG: hypothetical protein LUI87_10055 [Lachnospiraceae bacterium]|nr:hypothetical protein [Lachnospiraceae bacterium]